jgi:hypothetical protein
VTASSRLATAIVGFLVLSFLVTGPAKAGHYESAGAQSAPAQGSRPVPDITGSWQRLGATVGVKPTAKPDPKLLPPPAAQPVLKPQYQQERQQRLQAIREADAKGQPLANHNVYCIPDGMPAMMGAVFPMEILQSRGQITIIEEAYNQVRRILMDRPQKTLDDVELTFYGHSVGRWEGDTLVVDTIGIKENVRFQNAPHSAQMRIRERMRLMASDVLWNEITIEDPVTLEKPWTFTYAYQRMPDYTLLEYICEDNREYSDEKGLQQIRIAK